MKVIIKDFQSLEDVKLDVSGLTLLVGESGAGKSSVCRALQAALFNRFKGGQVRFGQDHATIKIKFEDSDDVLTVQRSWAGGSPRMKLGDQIFSKLGRNLPKEVADYVNFGTLEIGGDLYSCNIHPQFQKPLLLEFSQQKVMELLSASTALDDLKEAKEAVLEDRTKVKGAISAVDQMLATVTSQVNKGASYLNKVAPLVEEIAEAADDYENTTKALDLCHTLREHLKANKAMSDYILVTQQLLLVVNDFNSCIDIDDNIYKVRMGLYKSCVMEDVEEMLAKVVSNAHSLVHMDKVSELRALRESLQSITNQESCLTAQVNVTKDIVKTQKSYTDYSASKNSISTLRAFLSTMQHIVEEEKSLVDIVENHICPVCGSKVK